MRHSRKKTMKITAQPRVMVIDVGGSHVKVKLDAGDEIRCFDSGRTLSAAGMAAGVKQITRDWSYDAITIGYPGVVVHGAIAAEPRNLGPGWIDFDFEKAFACPVKLINDAAMQALGSYEGGHMLFLGLGTGLGSAMVFDGVIAPMEIAHLPYKNGKSFEMCVGEEGLKRSGIDQWRADVAEAVALFTATLLPDYVVLGGGNVRLLETLPPKARLGDNANAFLGGCKLWEKEAGAAPR